CPIVKHIFIFRHMGSDVLLVLTQDLWWYDKIKKQCPYCPLQIVNGFTLYTLLHTTENYLLSSTVSFKYVFNYHEGDIYDCMTDIG
ncbi:3992_t:CDS:1, partial [Diversispora eburnea]